MIKANDDHLPCFKTGNSPPVYCDDKAYFGIQSFANGQTHDSSIQNYIDFDT